jgi:hypothetical protein
MSATDPTAQPQVLTIQYERLFNLGNYENEKLIAAVTVVNGDVAGAFAAARAIVEETQAGFQTERKRAREEAERRQREEWEAERQQRLQARQEQATIEQELVKDDGADDEDEF